MINTNERLMNITETAEFLGLKKATIYSYVHKETIPYYKLGNRVMFSPSMLLKFLNAKLVMPACMKEAS
jgi:excisionase family DNA binding protein